MTRFRTLLTTCLVLAAGAAVSAQEDFESAVQGLEQQLVEAMAELDALREEIAAEKIPMSRQLGDLESELIGIRAEFQQTTRLLDSRTLDLSNLRTEIKSRRDESAYLSNLLSQYIQNFESRLHIAELQRFDEPLQEARLAPENTNLTEGEVTRKQSELLSVSIDRLFDALGGASFEGTAVDPSGLVKEGQFVMCGPAALFRSADGSEVGTAEQRLGSLEPAIVAFATPEDGAAAGTLVADGGGRFPLDPTLGNAHKVEATQESFLEHVEKGGAIMYPIAAMAGASLLVALLKWLGLLTVRKPSKRKINALLEAVSKQDEKAINEKVKAIRGPAGRMLAKGVEHIREPRELIEEVMYETVLTTKLKVQRFLPFIAICAASAPLLGLLGTVTGIINTFKLITVFGSGDVKTLSGGISEALITTKFGLIVAIPSLLLHAFLYRKAHGVVGQMETVAVSFANEVSKTSFSRAPRIAGGEAAAGGTAPDPDLVRGQVSEILNELLDPLVKDNHTSNGGSGNDPVVIT